MVLEENYDDYESLDFETIIEEDYNDFDTPDFGALYDEYEANEIDEFSDFEALYDEYYEEYLSLNEYENLEVENAEDEESLIIEED